VIAELKPYPEYKDSGLPWLGHVPENWEIAPLAHLARQKAEIGQVERPLLSVYLNRGVVKFDDVDAKRTNATSEDLSQYQAVDPGDFVLNNQQAWRGSVGVSSHRGIVSPAYYVLKLSDHYLPRYADLLFRERSMVAQYLVSSKGVGTIQRNLYWPHLKRVGVVVPPLDEQAAIVQFLEWANGILDRAIRAKRKVIALLNEQKQATIHRAVTRGLSDSVGTVDSDELLERTKPSHWPVVRAKWLLRQVSLEIPEDAEMVTCFRDGQVTLRSNRRTTGFMNAIWELGYQGIRPGQLVLHSMDAFAGAIGVSDSSGKCSPEYVICEAGMEGISLEYYAYLLRSLALRGLFVALCPSVRERAPRVRFSDFARFSLPKPPLSEQLEIVKHIRTACMEVDSALVRLRSEVGLLGEFKTRLMADVVTGKLDVREAASRLPDELRSMASDDDTELSDESEAIADEGEAIE